MAAGPLNKRVKFEREDRSGDGGGGNARVWMPLATVWGGFKPERGRERLEAGRLEAANAAVLVVRSSTVTRDVKTSDRAIIDGVEHQIRSITNPDQRNKMVEMIVERGVAT